MKVIADLQIHSKYSRAVSQEMVIPKIWEWAKRKGIALMATGDWTHPLWMREIKANLEETGRGLLKLKDQKWEVARLPARQGGGKLDKEVSSEKLEYDPLFLLATEVSCIYSQGGKLRRIHTLIWAPSIESAEKINKELINRGANLVSDGRPIVGLTSIAIAELVFSIDPTCLIIPAHCWTPWFSLYGSESGFDSIDECFGNFAKYIYAIETGLSSDPAMNWRIKELDNRSIVSFSDAHSGPKLGREATVFDLSELSYKAIRAALVRPAIQTLNKGPRTESRSIEAKPKSKNQELIESNKIDYTVEFYPEEGKYHYTGHRNCGVKQDPSETRKNGTICPVCGRKLTVGVMHRVDELAGRTEEELEIKKMEIKGVQMEGIGSKKFYQRPPYMMMVPLQEILAEVLKTSTHSQAVQNEYGKLLDNLGSEFEILLSTATSDITRISGPEISGAIGKVRDGQLTIDPGYDGVFGKVKIFSEKSHEEEEKKKEQLSLF